MLQYTIRHPVAIVTRIKGKNALFFIQGEKNKQKLFSSFFSQNRKMRFYLRTFFGRNFFGISILFFEKILNFVIFFHSEL